MSYMSTHEHLEHAEHAEQHVHTPFDRSVALTIAVVAAILATVTVMAHRAHTDTLLLQGQAISRSNESFDKWSLYQAQKIRLHMDEDTKRLLNVVAIREGGDKDKKEALAKVQKNIDKYKDQLPDWEKEARALTKESQDKSHESHAMHERGARYDLGELFVEVALVLCSIAILTRRRSFWYSGMGVCALGTVLGLSAFFGWFMSTPAHDTHQQEHHGGATKTDKEHDHKPDSHGEGGHP
jgi:hypothetical protein